MGTRYEASLTVASPPNGCVRLAVCRDCGALVINIPAHDRHHERATVITITNPERP